MSPPTAWATQPLPAEERRTRFSPWLADSLFLAAVVGFSTILYVGRLGFYSDDWGSLAVLATAEDQSFIGLISDQFPNPNKAMRPTQIVFQAVLFHLFGTEPFGYHLVNTFVLITMAVVLCHVLRRLGLPRMLCVAIPAVYALMPNYSTVRFWFASFGYALSMAFYLFGLYADLRAASSNRRTRVWTWKALALIGLSVAAFGYEVVIPLVVLNIVLSEIVARRVPGGFRTHAKRSEVALLHGSTLAVAAAAIAYKASVALGAGEIGSSLIRYVLWLGSGSVGVNFGTYGVGLPHTVVWGLPYAGVAGVAVAVSVGIATYRYLETVREPGHRFDLGLSRKTWGLFGATGIASFILGYSIFLTTARIGFSSTGIANRVATAATLGASIVLIAVLGWVTTWVKSPVSKDRSFRAGIAALCVAGVMVINGLGNFWAQSWQAQQDVLAELRDAFPELPTGSTVLLAGVCPYIGPAIVFESSWDLRGALRLQHRDRSLEADVTSGAVSVEPRGVVTRIYQVEAVHTYGERLYLYDRRSRSARTLTDEAVAREALLGPPNAQACPEGHAGAGTIFLPFDSLVDYVRTRLGF